MRSSRGNFLQLLCFCLTLYWANCSWAQNRPNAELQIPISNVDNLVQGRLYKPVYLFIKGSQYLTKSWELGKVKLLDKSYSDLPLWYDVFADDVIYLYRQPTSFEFIRLSRKHIQHFYLGNRLFINLEYSGFNAFDLKKGFYEVVYEDKVSFLVKRKIETVERQSVTHFVRKDARYLIKEGKALRVRNKKSFLSAAGTNYKKQLQKFMKKERIYLSNKDDAGWLAVVQYLNTLQTN